METSGRTLLLWTLLCGFLLTAAASAKTLILCGGYVSDGNTEIWNKAVALAGGRGVARIGVLTAASSQPITQGREYKALFESYNVMEAYWIPIHENNMDATMDDEVVKKIKTMTGFFFGGGKQQTYIMTLLMKDRQATPAFAAIRDMYNNGTLVMGTSAGAMVMPSVYTMVEGTSYSALLYGALKVGDDMQAGDLLYDSEGGLGFIGGHIIDSHFHERGRQGRLIRLLADTMKLEGGTRYGIGIDEETGLLLTDVGTLVEKGEVIGRAGVFYVDLTNAYLDTSSDFFRLIGIFAHYANPGDVINMVSHTVAFNDQKQVIKGNEITDYATTSNNIFAQVPTGYRSEFRRIAESLFNSRSDSLTYGVTSEQTPLFYVIMTEDSRTRGVVEYEGELARISYADLKLEIRPFL